MIEVSRRVSELQSTFRERENLVQQLMQEEEQESFNKILKHEGEQARFNQKMDQHLPSNREVKDFLAQMEGHMKKQSGGLAQVAEEGAEYDAEGNQVVSQTRRKMQERLATLDDALNPGEEPTLKGSATLPAIKEKTLKNVKQSLREDLLLNGLIKDQSMAGMRRNSLAQFHTLGHSGTSKGAMLRKSPSIASMSANTNNVEAQQEKAYEKFLFQHQQNLVVSQPDQEDAVANNFENFFTLNSTQLKSKRSFSVAPPMDHSLQQLHGDNLSIQNALDSQQLMEKSPSLASKKTQNFASANVSASTLDRIPDSDHLARMRAHVLLAEAAAKEKGPPEGSKYAKTQEQQKEYKNSIQEEFGESLEDILNNHQKEMKREQLKKEQADAGISEEGSDYGSEGSSDYNETKEYEKEIQRRKEQQAFYEMEKKKDPRQNRLRDLLDPTVTVNRDVRSIKEECYRHGLKYCKDCYMVRALSALNIITENGDLVNQIRAENKTDKHKITKQMKQNEFFRKFAAQYSNQIQHTLEKDYGKDFAAIAKVKNFDTKLVQHLVDNNHYRQKAPKLFTGVDKDSKKELGRNVESKFRLVVPPPSIKRMQVYEERLQNVSARHKASQAAGALSDRRKSQPTRAMPDPLNDEQYVRRLKMANYGRWYVDPNEFGKQIDWFNEQVNINKQGPGSPTKR